MKITTTQKIIKIGTSRGITIPAKELARLGIKTGDEVEVNIESSKKSTIADEYSEFKKQYGETLKNLADR